MGAGECCLQLWAVWLLHNLKLGTPKLGTSKLGECCLQWWVVWLHNLKLGTSKQVPPRATVA